MTINDGAPEESALSWLKKIWTPVRSRVVLISGLVVGTAAFLGATLNLKEYLTTFGLLESKPLRIVSTRLNDNAEGAKVLEILVRNVGKEPIIMTDLILKPKRIVDLRPCDGSLVGALKISSKYDPDVSNAKAGDAVNVQLNQQIGSGESD